MEVMKYVIKIKPSSCINKIPTMVLSMISSAAKAYEKGP